MRTQVTRILREAVSNVIRHSGARHCRINLTLQAGVLRLDVNDDGRGVAGAADGAVSRQAGGMGLAALTATSASRKINSIHHQSIKDLAPGFAVEARCPDDGVIEAIRHTGDAWVAAVQWHPEFHKPEYGVLDDAPLLNDFLDAARAARQP